MTFAQKIYEEREEAEALGEAKIIKSLLQQLPIEQVAVLLKRSVQEITTIVNTPDTIAKEQLDRTN